MARVARITPSLLHRNRSCWHRLPDRSSSRLPALGGRPIACKHGLRSARLTREVLAALRAGEQAGERAQTLAESGRPAGSKRRRSVASPNPLRTQSRDAHLASCGTATRRPSRPASLSARYFSCARCSASRWRIGRSASRSCSCCSSERGVSSVDCFSISVRKHERSQSCRGKCR